MKKLGLDIVLMNEQHLCPRLTVPNITTRLLADTRSQSIPRPGVRETGKGYER